MCADKDSTTFLPRETLDQIMNMPCRNGVKARGGLVEKQDVGTVEQGTCQREPLFHVRKTAQPAGCFGDIGTHAYNLGRFITGLIPSEISCHLKTYESGRKLDDYGTAVIRYTNGGLGTVTASQISHGRENDLWIEVDGTKGSLEWHQENPNQMFVRVNGQPQKIYTRAGGPYLSNAAAAATRAIARRPPAGPRAAPETASARARSRVRRGPAR